MDRRRVISSLGAGAAIIILPLRLAAGADALVDGARWQISTATPDLPTINHTSIRLDEQNRVHAASWNDGHILTGVSDIAELGDVQAGQFRDLVTRRESGLLRFLRPKKSRSQISGGIEFALADQDSTWSRSTQEVTDEAADLVRGVLEAVPLHKPVPGRYVWTKFLSGIFQTDVDLRDSGDSAIKRAILQSLQSVRIIAPISQGYEPFFVGDYSARFEFGARLTNGYAGFGVVRA